MGIPKKPKPGMFASFWTAQSQRKYVRIRDLPKLKLLKWTAYFFVSSISFFMFFGGPRQLYNQERYGFVICVPLQQSNYVSRLLNDARALEKAGYLGPGSDKKGRIGSSQTFSSNYGFDYAREKRRSTEDTGE